MTRFLYTFLTLSIFLFAESSLATAQSFSDAEKSEIEKIVQDYIRKNPELVLQALEEIEKRQREEQDRRFKQLIFAHADQLERDSGDPVLGNPDGDVTIVEFFDYQCGYCKRMTGPLMEFVKADGNVRLVVKEFPILGPASTIAARASLGALAQDKYEAFHLAMMAVRGKLDQETILQVALEVGLDMEKLQASMNNPEIETQIRKSYRLAQTLSISGTPAFVIGEDLLPGAVSQEVLRQSVEKARAAN